MTVPLRAHRRRRRETGERSAIHQFHSAGSYGDGVTNSMLLTRTLLHDLGFESDIYVDQADPRLRGDLLDFREYAASAANLLLVHHSIGHELVERVLALPDRKVLIYHNITPPGFFPDNAWARRHVELGREQLAHYRPAVVGALCDSAFNANELLALGYENVTVLPLLLATDRLREAPWDAGIVEANAATFTVLFVGRVERNKCQHDVIEVFRWVDRWLGCPAQCVLVGKQNPCVAYVHELRHRVAAFGLADRIHFAGHVPYDELYAWYRAADVYLSMSEHEGFGIPLIEAMAFDVPVIAYASSSVPDTLGGAGVLVDGKSIEEIAALICLLADDPRLCERIVARQRERCRMFSNASLRSQLAVMLERLGISIPEGQGRDPCSGSTIPRSVQRN
jgi:glycosyltransferase involved in cell wall biosynthesis